MMHGGAAGCALTASAVLCSPPVLSNVTCATAASVPNSKSAESSLCVRQRRPLPPIPLTLGSLAILVL